MTRAIHKLSAAKKFRDQGDLAFEVEQISRRIQPMLKGRPANVQSGILADLLSLWLAGHWPPEVREELLKEFIELVRDLVPESEKELFGPAGHPAGRSEKRS